MSQAPSAVGIDVAGMAARVPFVAAWVTPRPPLKAPRPRSGRPRPPRALSNPPRPRTGRVFADASVPWTVPSLGLGFDFSLVLLTSENFDTWPVYSVSNSDMRLAMDM